MSFFPRKCAKCRERRVVPVTERYEAEVDHDGKTYFIAIPDLTLLKCESCGNRVLPADGDDRVSEAVRAAAGLLHPSQIRQERLHLNLSQEHFAELLMIAEATVSRWETGAQVQSLHMDEMLRAFFRIKEFRDHLKSRLSLRKSPPEVIGAASATSSASHASVGNTL